MQATSILFFVLILAPLLFFLFWALKQDKKRKPLGIVLLIIGIIIAIYTILRLDAAFVKEKNLIGKPSTEAKP